MSNGKMLYFKELMLDVSFYELKEALVRRAGNHFDRNYCTKDFIHFDFMNDGVFSKYNLHRIKLFNIQAFKQDENNGKVTVRFKLYRAALILYPLVFVLLGMIPFFQKIVDVWGYVAISGGMSMLILLYLNRKFKTQYDYLQQELDYLIHQKKCEDQ
ncbi:MAG: hypothetical protein JW717_11445 [Marinilabiliaceae bacterium]|nr:hypothetical protein [Marinilabiliaceae bacterium]